MNATLSPRTQELPIGTVEDLRRHLQWAVELEHATLPPYLCALYSLDPLRNADAVAVLSGILVEEMLHLGLAANILNAVGGRPRFDRPEMLRPYPRPLPHGDATLTLSLGPFDREALDTFLNVERPAALCAPAESDRYETIGQFYAAIEDGLRRLCSRLGERAVFDGDPSRQVDNAVFRHTAGRLVAVKSLATALVALAEIVDQGEGAGRLQVWDGEADVFHPDHEEVAHFYRLQELRLGRRYRPGDTPQTGPTGEAAVVDFDAVMPMRRNPRLAEHDVGHPIRAAQDEFNLVYCTMLQLLDGAFNGSPALLDQAISTMYILRSKALALLEMPDGADCVAGPTFDFVPRGAR